MTQNSSDDRAAHQDNGKASQLLEEVRARLAAIVESSDDAIIGKDLDGTIVSWNRGAERLFQYTAEEVIGKSVTVLIPPDRFDEEPEILGRVRRGDRVDHYETVRRRKDGTLLDISLTVSPIRDAQGKVVGASKIARDITERKNVAKRAALDQETVRRLFELGNQCLRPGDHLVENLSEMLETAMWITGAEKGNVQLFDEDARALTLVVEHGFAHRSSTISPAFQ